MGDATEAETPPRVFFSYSHDSDAHRKRVLALSERLREDGIDADLDQYVKGTPPEKWPRWMLNRLHWADFVLVICTPTYYRRFRGYEEPGKGQGVDWEGAVITNEIYAKRSATLKFVPVLFDPADQDSIPEPVQGQSFYCLSSATDYQKLYDFLLGQSGIEPRPLGQIKRKARKARERAAPLSFPGTENGQISHEMPTNPAQLWPDDTQASASDEATDCYTRLYAICARGEVPESEERRGLWQAVKKDRPSSFLAWQLATVARWGTPEYLEVDEHFTPLQVQVRTREQDEGPAEKQQLPFDTLADAMTAVFEERLSTANVIFAPPGAARAPCCVTISCSRHAGSVTASGWCSICSSATIGPIGSPKKTETPASQHSPGGVRMAKGDRTRTAPVFVPTPGHPHAPARRPQRDPPRQRRRLPGTGRGVAGSGRGGGPPIPRCALALRLPAAGLLPAPGRRSPHPPARNRGAGHGAQAHQGLHR